jgi:phosphatidylglycerophosphate synthase
MAYLLPNSMVENTTTQSPDRFPDDQETGWTLVLEAPNGDPCHVVAGLPVVLRLALDAQSGGATAVVVRPDADGQAQTQECLADPRLKIAVSSRSEGSEGSEEPTKGPIRQQIHVPASWVLHRRLLGAVAEADASSGKTSRDLATEPFDLSTPFGFEPIDVVDRASARKAERALFHALRKEQDGWTSRWLNRPISLAISRWLVKTPLLPNQVTAVILLVGLLGAGFAAVGTWGFQVLGALLFHAQSVLDGCDGEMSRVTNRGSKLGEWLDTVGDDITNYAFFVGAAWGLYRQSGEALYLIVGWGGIALGMLATGIEYRYLIRIGSGDLLKYPLSEGAGEPGSFASAIQPLFKRDTFVFITLVATVFGGLGVMVIVFSIGAVIVLANVLKTEARMARTAREGTKP